MDYKKLHKDTINKLQQMVNSGKITAETARGICADFVPESEDERMIQYFKDLAPFDKAEELYEKYGFSHKDAIAWLENKLDDKVESKFKVGDWFIKNDGSHINKEYNTCKISKVGNVYYAIESIYGDTGKISFESFDENYHLWTIQDARDGDVLTCYSDIKGQPIEQTGIIKQYVGRHGGCSNSFKAHFGVDWDNNVVIEGYMGSSNIYPATKEQRDALLKAMTDAGYTFDFEKKELKKIGQKPAWSEEDEEIHRKCICAMRASSCGFPEEEKFVEQVDNWLKSLKDRYTWKPSDEQMNALNYVVNLMASSERPTENDLYYNILKSLRQQLKKLRGE